MPYKSLALNIVKWYNSALKIELPSLEGNKHFPVEFAGTWVADKRVNGQHEDHL